MVVVCSQHAYKDHDASVGEENVATVGEENAGNGTDYSHDIDKELQAASESQGARNAKMS